MLSKGAGEGGSSSSHHKGRLKVGICVETKHSSTFSSDAGIKLAID